MFKFLKDKLKKAVNKFTKTAEKEIIEEKVEDKKIIEQVKAKERKETITEIPDTKEAIEHRKEKIKKEKVEKQPKQKTSSDKKIDKTTKKETEITELDDKGFEEKQNNISETKKIDDNSDTTVSAIEKQPKKEIENNSQEDKNNSKKNTKIEINKIPEKETHEENLVTPEPVAEEESKGFFSKLTETFTKKQLSEEKFEELFWELELSMLENNVAVEVIEKIKNDLKEALTTGKVSRGGIDKLVINALKDSLEELFIEPFDLVETINNNKKPFVIAFIGVNGSGKTTTLAKIANLFQENDLSVVMAASDTFRAAAIDQLKEHADNLSIKMISQGYNADPAAVAYDAIEYAKAKNIDVVMIDTAGRLHSNTNLMAELEKVIRVSKPDLKIFIGESITGNDCVEQATEFNKLVGIDAIILSKADVDEKGGAAISVSYVTGKPIIYLGVGQAYGDLVKFDKEKIIKSMGL